MSGTYTTMRLMVAMLVASVIAVAPVGCSDKEETSNSPATAQQGTSDKLTILDTQVLQETTPVALQDRAHPFPRRLEIPEFPRDAEWLNTKPLTKGDLKGKFVLMDFWTYCCINCIHILPELKKLEKAYAYGLEGIGVNSARFKSEEETENSGKAILRYEIEPRNVNDASHRI